MVCVMLLTVTKGGHGHLMASDLPLGSAPSRLYFFIMIRDQTTNKLNSESCSKGAENP